jgi:hypothetical protein
MITGAATESGPVLVVVSVVVLAGVVALAVVVVIAVVVIAVVVIAVEVVIVVVIDTMEKVAVTDCVSPVVEVTVHDPVPMHAPDHPLNSKPALGAAVRSTMAPHGNVAEAIGPEVPMPIPITAPLPWTATLTVNCGRFIMHTVR